MAARIVGALPFRGRARPGLGGKPLLLFAGRFGARRRGELLGDAPFPGEPVGRILRERLLLGFGARTRRRIAQFLLLLAPARLLQRRAFRGAALARRFRGLEVGLEEGFGLGVQRALGLFALARAVEEAGLGVGASLRSLGERRHGSLAVANVLGVF